MILVPCPARTLARSRLHLLIYSVFCPADTAAKSSPFKVPHPFCSSGYSAAGNLYFFGCSTSCLHLQGCSALSRQGGPHVISASDQAFFASSKSIVVLQNMLS